MAPKINDYILDLIPTEERIYFSSDSICRSSTNSDDDDVLYPIEFVNLLKFAGIPNHALRLKNDVPIILLHNVSQSAGLCKDTRFIVIQLGK